MGEDVEVEGSGACESQEKIIGKEETPMIEK